MIQARVVRLLAAFMLALIPMLAPASEDGEADRTLSPYFFVHGDGTTEQLPLKGTDVEVSVAGVIADVKVTQHYRNDGKNAIEAQYVFPGSTRAAVYALSMAIGERKVVAQIREKGEAQRISHERGQYPAR
jgi:Ca-activated chloride channel family protein